MSDDLTDILGSAYATYPGESVKPGVVCIAVVPYVMERCYVIRPENPDPRSSEHQRYQLIEKNPAELAAAGQDSWRFPFKDLNLDTNEDLLIVKVKRRPVVVLSRSIVDERKADPSRLQDSFWCAPSYTLVDNFAHPQFQVDFIEEVMALSYRCFFPLPYEPHLHDRQAMLRLERTQPIPRHLLNPIEWRLTQEWTLYLQEWLRFYITGRLGDDDTDKNSESIPSILKTARGLLINELNKNRIQQEGQSGRKD